MSQIVTDDQRVLAVLTDILRQAVAAAEKGHDTAAGAPNTGSTTTTPSSALVTRLAPRERHTDD